MPLTYSGTSLTVKIPNAVASYQDVWWIRVHTKATATPAGIANKWSARSEARPLQVGDAVLSCDATSSSGNFGSIDFPWGGNDLDDLEMAIQKGPQPPETLKAWSGALPGDNACHGMAGSGAVYSEDSSVKENTNCVNTVTGLKAKPAYDGYLKAGSGKLLVDTLPACTAVGRPTRGSLGENSDVLSCFLNKDTLKLSDAVGYTGSVPLFTQDIYKSPRFAIVPILDHDPSGNKWMPIMTFVPAFITDQPTGASRTAPLVTGATDNGLVIQNPEKLPGHPDVLLQHGGASAAARRHGPAGLLRYRTQDDHPAQLTLSASSGTHERRPPARLAEGRLSSFRWAGSLLAKVPV